MADRKFLVWYCRGSQDHMAPMLHVYCSVDKQPWQRFPIARPSLSSIDLTVGDHCARLMTFLGTGS